VNIGRTKSLFNDDFFAHSRYLLYDSQLKIFQIEDSGWKLINIEEPQDRSRELYYYISDPTGEM
jgi:hypothetical protein